MEKPGMLFPKAFGSFLFPLMATMHAGEGSGEDTSEDTLPKEKKNDGPGVPSEKAVHGMEEGAGAVPGCGVGAGRAVRSPEERLALVARSYGRAMSELAGTPDPEGHALLQEALASFGDGGDTHGAEGSAEEGSVGATVAGHGERRTKGGTEGGEARDDLMALMERTR